MKLVSENSDVLYSVAEEVTDIETQVMPHVKAMKKIMRLKKGVGLAAPQVGLGVRFFITSIEGLRIVINPSVSQSSPDRKSMQEGCLSFPKRKKLKKRSNRILVGYTNQKGNPVAKILTEFHARVFQHELDHLNGICLFDR